MINKYTSKFYLLFFVGEESVYICDNFFYELGFFTIGSIVFLGFGGVYVLKHHLKEIYKAEFHKHAIKLLIGVNIKQSVDSLRPPFLKLKERYINDQISENLPNISIFLSHDCIFLRIEVL